MSVGSGKHMRRWRNVGAIMAKRHTAEAELRERFGRDQPPKKVAGFFAQLTPQQQKAALDYRGEDC